MASVDHGRQHVRADFTTPHCGAEGVFQRLNAHPFGGAGLQAIDSDCIRVGLINFIGDDEALTIGELVKVRLIFIS